VTSPLIGRDLLRRQVSADGGEREIVIMFADLHDFTRLAETRLPYLMSSSSLIAIFRRWAKPSKSPAAMSTSSSVTA